MYDFGTCYLNIPFYFVIMNYAYKLEFVCEHHSFEICINRAYKFGFYAYRLEFIESVKI